MKKLSVTLVAAAVAGLVSLPVYAQPVPSPGLKKVVHSTAFTGDGTNTSMLDLTHGCSSGESLAWSGTAWGCAAGGGITNSAGAGVIPVSDGTNLIASPIQVTGSQSVVFSTFAGANAVGLNIWIGGGGQSSVGDPSNTFWGSHNESLGVGALASCTTCWENTAIGWFAQNSTTTGSANIAVGAAALQNNTSGGNNIAMSSDALVHNTSGSGNVAIGASALAANLTSNDNLAIGYQAALNTTGDNNIALGDGSLLTNTSGASNVAIGVSALAAAVSVDDNIAIGTLALTSTTASDNLGIGKQALFSNVGGSFDIGLGFNTLGDNVDGYYNIAIGALANEANVHGAENITIGVGAAATATGSNNTIIGSQSGGGLTTGGSNTIIGRDVTGLSGGLSNNVILADGAGNIRYQDNAGAASIPGSLDVTGLVGANTQFHLGAKGARINAAVGTLVEPYVIAYSGDPNGVSSLCGGGSCDKGSLALDAATPALWQNTSGSTVWTKPGGGAVVSDEIFGIDADPASASANDDEFNGSTLNGFWTVVGNGSMTATAVVSNSSMMFQKTASTANISGYTQSFTPGSSAFTFQAKIGVVGEVGGFVVCGILLTDGTKYLVSGLFNNGTSPNVGIIYWNSAVSFNSNLVATTFDSAGAADLTASHHIITRPSYVELIRDASSSDLTVGWSANGLDWFTATATSALSNISTISGVGVGCTNNSGALLNSRWWWFRKTV